MAIMSGHHIHFPICHPHVIRVTDSRATHLLNLSEQVYLQADGSTTTFVNLQSKELVICHHLGHFEKELPCCFVRVHKSYIISLHHLLSIGADHTMRLALPKQPCIPLGAGYRAGFEAAFLRWNAFPL